MSWSVLRVQQSLPTCSPRTELRLRTTSLVRRRSLSRGSTAAASVTSRLRTTSPSTSSPHVTPPSRRHSWSSPTAAWTSAPRAGRSSTPLSSHTTKEPCHDSQRNPRRTSRAAVLGVDQAALRPLHLLDVGGCGLRHCRHCDIGVLLRDGVLD